MDLAMQLVSHDKTVRSDTVQDLKEFNHQSLTTQTEKIEQLVPMKPAIENAFDLMGDDIIVLSKKGYASKSKIGFYDEKWLEELKANLLKQIDDEKRSNLIMSRMKKQLNKQFKYE